MGEHYKFSEDKETMWKNFQQHMKIPDEEVEYFKNDPRRNYWMPRISHPSIQDWTMVIEVVSSESCCCGMKVGDKLYFKNAGGVLDLKRSTPNCWCAHATQSITGFLNNIHNLLFAGVEDPNVYIYNPEVGCTECGTKFGMGRVIMRVWCFRESLGENYKDWAWPEKYGCYDE